MSMIITKGLGIESGGLGQVVSDLSGTAVTGFQLSGTVDILNILGTVEIKDNLAGKVTENNIAANILENDLKGTVT